MGIKNIAILTSCKEEAANLEKLLVQLGYQFCTTTSSESNIESIVDQDKPDFILIDTTDAGSLFDLDVVKKYKDKSKIPVTFIVDANENDNIDNSKAEDFHANLTKPFGVCDLHLIIRFSLYKEEMINKLKESERWYSTVLKSIDEAVIITNKEREIVFLNPAGEALIGTRLKESYKKDIVGVINVISEGVPKQSVRPLIQVLWEGVTSGLNVGASNCLKVKAADGTVTIIEHSGSLIRDESGEMIGVVFIFRDITSKMEIAELKEKMYEQQLVQADKMVSLGTLVSGVAHEINNPNNFIMLNTPMLQDVWTDVIPILEKHYEENGDFDVGGLRFTEMKNYIPQLFSGINDGSNRIKRIVADLKNFTRQVPANMNEAVEVNSVVESALTLVNHHINKATNEFSVNYGEALPKIYGNGQRLEQVIINLVLNSCQALHNMKEGIFVSTSCNESNDVVAIEIRDEGCGMESDIYPRVFDPFFTTKRDSGGTGMGLSVSAGIIKDHGGELNFISEKGKGTTFTISLPVPERG